MPNTARRDATSLQQLRRACRWNLGVLAIVHDPNLAARHADTIALLAQRTIIAQGTPHEIMLPELIERCYGFAVRMLDTGNGTTPVAVPV